MVILQKNPPDEDTNNQKTPRFVAAHREGKGKAQGTGGQGGGERQRGKQQTASGPLGGWQWRGLDERGAEVDREGGTHRRVNHQGLTGTWAQAEGGKGGGNGRKKRRQNQARGMGLQGAGETWGSGKGR